MPVLPFSPLTTVDKATQKCVSLGIHHRCLATMQCFYGRSNDATGYEEDNRLWLICNMLEKL